MLLRLISWQYARKHLVRTLLTVAGIVLGVAVFVAMHTSNQSVLHAFEQTVDRIAGAAQLQVSAGETGFDESVLERVQSVEEVAAAAPVIEAVVNTGSQGNLLILGVDMTGDRSLRSYDVEGGGEGVIDDPLVFLAQADSMIVTEEFARRNGLARNSKLPLSTMDGERTFTVRGVMKPGGVASAFGGNLAVMDIYAAQKMFGRGRKFDRIDIAVRKGARVEDVQRELRQVLGAGLRVDAPAARGQQFESMSRGYTISAGITSVFALFIGMFIIYNTFSIAVAQRRPEIGILRALGATRGQIQMLFLGESVALGMLGSAVGVGLGIVLARGMTGYISGLLGQLYGMAAHTEQVSADARLIEIAFAAGVATSVAAAILPARNAARIDPVKALHKGSYQTFSETESRARRWASLAALLGALACLFLSRSKVCFYAGDVLAMGAALLLTPALSLWLARALRPLLRWLRPVEGTLAADSLIQSPRRTSGAVAALMLSLAMCVSLGGLARASYDSILQWLDVTLNPDLFISASENLTERSFVFPGEMGDELRHIPGIAVVQPVRDGRVTIANTPVMLLALDVKELRDRARLRPVTGDPASMYTLTGAGKGVMVSENFSLLHGFKYGDIVDLPTPAGMLKLPIVGIVTDYSDQQGTVLIDRGVFIKYWNDTSVNIFRIYLAPGAVEADVRQRIVDKFGSNRRLFVLANRDVRSFILRLTDQWFGITYLQIAVAVLVAILGIVNTLTVSITDRRRELGVLQAVGGLRGQIRHTIWIEALAIGAIGLILGLALGGIQLLYSLEMAKRDIAGLRLAYEYPYQIALLLVPVILGAALLSALGPAESAVRGSLVEALEYE